MSIHHAHDLSSTVLLEEGESPEKYLHHPDGSLMEEVTSKRTVTRKQMGRVGPQVLCATSSSARDLRFLTCRNSGPEEKPSVCSGASSRPQSLPVSVALA